MEKNQMPNGCRRSCSCYMPGSTPYKMPRTMSPASSEAMNCAISRSMQSNSSCCEKKESMYQHLEHLPVAMAYVPYQKFSDIYDTCYALKVGTIFPVLCKPFCGKRGMMQ